MNDRKYFIIENKEHVFSLTDEHVINRAVTRSGTISNDYNYHIAAILKSFFFGEPDELEICNVMTWCVRLIVIEPVKIKPFKVIKYLLQSIFIDCKNSIKSWYYVSKYKLEKKLKKMVNA